MIPPAPEHSLKLKGIRGNHGRKQQLRHRRRCNRRLRCWDKWQMARGASPPGYYPITILISLSAISFTFQFALRLLSFGCNLSIKVFVRQQKAVVRARARIKLRVRDKEKLGTVARGDQST